MKWFNHRAWIQYQKDIKVKRGHKLDMYLPWVVRIANQFPRHQIAIGCLDINDLIQAGNLGLIEAWARVDHTRTQAEIWSFLKKRIKFAIRQEIDKYANEIKIPERIIREARKELKPLEKTLVNIFPRFFSRELKIIDNSPWQSVQLEELIDDALMKYVHNVDHRTMLLKFYGIGFERMSIKQIAQEYNVDNSSAITKIIQRTRDKLKNQEFEKIIENFYQNES